MAPASPNRFGSLPARPPTPPREVDRFIDDALQFLSDSFEVEEATGDAPATADLARVNTPPQQSPASSAERANNSGRRKKVDFSPWTAYHSVNDLATSRRGLPGSPLRPLPQPRDPKTLKSILKAHDTPPAQPSTPTSGQPARNPSGFATMLETLVKQLAGQSRSHKIDAYMALVNTLKTYEGKPDAKSLADKMGLFTQFMQRDMTATNIQTGGLDVQLALQAVKLLVALMEIGPAAERIPETFRTFFLDKAIETFSDATAPKQWVNHILHAFAQQKFGKSVNVDRANRAITALKDIEDRVSGNNVVVCRTLAYRTLLVQQKPVMIERASDWIQHILHGLLSGYKDICVRAIELGTAAGISVGKEDEKFKVPRITMEILAKPIDDGRTYGDYFTDRLIEMLSDAEAAQHVPHIWATVVLLLRNRRHKLESWKLLKKWLQVFQKCVNSSNKEVAIQANGAWNRFVYAIRPTHSTPQAFRNLLKQALVAQFERRGTDKDGQRMKRSAFSSYCNLLYYSLSPTAPPEQLDLYWQEFVVEVLPTMVQKDRRGPTTACKLLTALFRRNPTKLWRENLAVESATITLDNLIALDPRWTRRRLGHILQPFELCFASAPWTYNSPSEEMASGTPVKSMWTALMAAVAEAGSKEVTVSMDFKEACAHITNLFHRLWMNYPKSFCLTDESSQTWIEKFAFIVLTTVELLGPGSFADPILSRSPTGDFEVAQTPSHRSYSRGSLQSPLLHLLQAFATDTPTEIEVSSLLQLSGQLLALCCQAKPSRRSKLELLRNSVRESSSSSDNLFKAGIWRSCAQHAESCLQNSGLPTAADRASQSLGEEYHCVLEILTEGLEYGTEEDLGVASALYEVFVSRVQREVNDGAGSAAVALAVTEPLAERLQSPSPSANSDAVTRYSTLLIRHTEHPKNRKAIEQARRTLWGVSGPQRQADVDPFNHLYKMVDLRLQSSYKALETLTVDLVIEFAATLGALFQRCPVSSTALLLRRVQDGIAVWIRDTEQKLTGDTDEAKGGRKAVYVLWDIVMAAVESVPQHDTRLLRALETLVTAGLRSERLRVVNSTIETWNRTFGAQHSLQYPHGIERALRRLLPIVDLTLPEFPEAPSDEDPEPVPIFEDSQEDIVSKPLRLEEHGPPPLVPRPNDGADPSRAQPDPAPSRRTQASSASNSRGTAQLRHDDSQIEFAPIESSPMARISTDSQLLTDHQKEVRERQQDTAAMFPDISSSPSKQARSKNLELPVYGSPGEGHNGNEDADPSSSPLLNLQEYEGAREAPTSSPTPKSRKQRYTEDVLEAPYVTSSVAEQLFDTNIPSSPPDVDDGIDRQIDPSVVEDSFVGHEKGLEIATEKRLNDLEELDEDMVDQLVGDVSNLSDSRTDKSQRVSSPASGSSDGIEPELPSSEIDEEVSQQLENEVIAQALRQSQTLSTIKKPILSDNTTVDEDQRLLRSEETADNKLLRLPQDVEVVSSFENLPQGTAGSFSETVRNKVNLDEAHEAGSPTEEDTSSVDLPIRSSSEKNKSLPQPAPPKAPIDESIVEDSFAAMDSEKPAPSNQHTRKSSGKSNRKSPGSQKKRKSLATVEDDRPKKRSKKDDASSSKLLQVSTNHATSGLGSDRDESVLSNIQVDGLSSDEARVDTAISLSNVADAKPSQPSQPEATPKRRKGAKPTSSPSTSSRTSPRLSGAAPAPALTQSRKRRSKLSQSQTTEQSVDDTETVADNNENVTEEAPTRKKKKGRSSRNSMAQKPSQTPSFAVDDGRGSVLGSSHPSPRPSFSQTEELAEGTAEGGKKRKRKRSYDEKGGAGGTAGGETRAGQQATGSQGSTASGGYEDSISQRSKVQPRSIMERLKRLLADCKKVVLGRDQVPELEKLMLEVRREVHEAARRGDEQSGS